MDLMTDSEFKQFIAEFKDLKTRSSKVSIDEARKMSDAYFNPPSKQKEPIKKVWDKSVDGTDGHKILIRFYNPEPDMELPIFIYYHRGGFVFGNVEASDAICRKLALYLGCIVASVDYRLAPENPFPKPVNDAYDAYRWISKHAQEIGGDPECIIVGGESAGSNLATCVALKARDNKDFTIAAQVLLYPMITPPINEEAYKNSPDQYFITKESMELFWKSYLQDAKETKNPYAVPMHADLKNLPPAIIITAEYDPLHEEGENYARKLHDAKNKVICERMSGVIHGFLDLPIYSEEQKRSWIGSLYDMLGELFGAESHGGCSGCNCGH